MPRGVAAQTPDAPPQVRTFYIAADEIDWDYFPRKVDGMMGMQPTGYAKLYTQRGKHLIGSVYRKAVYREYTDGTFSHLKARPASEAYLGLLGPMIHAEVGDTIKVVFRNHGTHPYSIHAHGVFYDKTAEGSAYAEGGALHMRPGDAVAPGETFTYQWSVPERAGPGPFDPSSIVWLYHSHVDERRDVNTGLIGALVVTRKGMAWADGTPKDVDKEFALLFMIFDENHSLFLKDNIKRFAMQPAKGIEAESRPLDANGNFDPLLGSGMANANFRPTINGYQFANMPPPAMKSGERVRWYVMSLGEGLNFHTAHWHGNTVTFGGQRTDVVAVGPSQSLTADMTPDDPGLWLVHCHVSEHMEAGMAGFYRVLP